MRPVPIRSLVSLIRYKVSIAVTFSAWAAALICRKSFSPLDLLPMAGIFLLASGASALNQFQEQEHDAKMVRTMNRPIPSSLLRPSSALWISLALILAGLTMFSLRELWITLLLGILTISWYNGFYTLLKRKTAFAVVPGALTGAIPVMMGWTSAGGNLFHPLPLFIAFFIFLWQVPHFWLLSIMHEEDYRNAGFPVLSDLFTVAQTKKIIFSWLLASSLSSVMMIFFGIVLQPSSGIFILVLNGIVMFLAVFLLFRSGIARYRWLFIMVNIFMLLVFLLIIADHMI